MPRRLPAAAPWPPEPDVEALKVGPHIVVGTPGRIAELIARQALRLEDIRMFILDGADVLLQNGLKELVFDTLAQLPTDVQLAVFGNAMEQDVHDRLIEFLRRPVCLAEPVVHMGAAVADFATSFYVDVGLEERKAEVLLGLIGALPLALQVVLHCRTRRRAAWLSDLLLERGLGAAVVHPDLAAVELQACLGEFRAGLARFLILTTTVLVCRISVEVSLLVNVDLPETAEAYLGLAAMLGRRGGRQHRSIVNLITTKEHGLKRELEEGLGIAFAPNVVLAFGM